MAFALVPTPAGLAAIAAAIAGAQLELTTMVLGDANGVPYEPDGSETTLVNELYSGALTQLAPNPGDPSRTLAQMLVPFGTAPFTVHEFGLKNLAGDLLFIGNYPAAEIPAVGSGAVREMVIQGVIAVSPANVVQLLIDPTILLATQQWVRDLIGGRARRHFFAVS